MTTVAPPRIRIGVADVVVAIVIGFLFAAGIWGAVGNLVGLPRFLLAARIPVPWVPLVAAVVLPVLIYAGALLLGRGRASFARAILLVVALAANSAISLSLYFLALSAIPARGILGG